MSLKEIFRFKVPQGKIALTWFNDYSGVIVKTPSLTVIFDPTDVDISDVSQANVVVVTHEHYDHFEAELVEGIHKQTNALIVTTPFVAKQLKNISPTMVKPLKTGESLTIDNVKLNAEYSSHPGNQPLTFILTSEDNIKVYHSSDSKPYSEMKVLSEKYKIDLAFCAVGIAPGTSPKSGVEVAKLIKPKVAIPYHTDNPSNLQKFVDLLGKEAPEIKAKILKKFEVYVYPE